VNKYQKEVNCFVDENIDCMKEQITKIMKEIEHLKEIKVEILNQKEYKPIICGEFVYDGPKDYSCPYCNYIGTFSIGKREAIIEVVRLTIPIYGTRRTKCYWEILIFRCSKCNKLSFLPRRDCNWDRDVSIEDNKIFVSD